jgi:hypothetical protein
MTCRPREEETQVTVFGGHRRDNHAEAKTQSAKHDHQQRHQKDGGVEVEVDATGKIIDVDGQEQAELDAHLDEVGGDDGQRHHQAREVHLAHDLRV